jgi:hypothetical protein
LPIVGSRRLQVPTQAQFAPILELWDLSQSRSRPSRGSHVYMLCSASDCVCMSMSVCLYMCVSLRVYVPIPSASLTNIHLSAHLNANPLTTSVCECRNTLALECVHATCSPGGNQNANETQKIHETHKKHNTDNTGKTHKGHKKKWVLSTKKHKVSSSDHLLQPWPSASKAIS